MADATNSPDQAATGAGRAGTVALVGRSNVGKSTLLNAALALPLAIVSHKPQTTRDRLLGIVRHRGAEIGILDTPGLHRAETRLGKEMNRTARAATREADVVVFVTAVPRPDPKGPKPHPADQKLMAEIAADVPVILAINKIDLLKDKRLLLPLMAAYAESHQLAAVVPISALREDGIALVLDEVVKLLPEGAARHGEDDLTDRPLRWFAAEYVREAILEATAQEVPHATAVTVDRFEEPIAGMEGVVEIAATIHVERDGQKRIVIGEGGQVLKRVGIAARMRIEELLERQVHLALWVRVTKDWRERPDQLADFGLLAEAGNEAGRRPRGKP